MRIQYAVCGLSVFLNKLKTRKKRGKREREQAKQSTVTIQARLFRCKYTK